MSGLSPEHHGELNAVTKVKPTRHDELRAVYAEDPLALEQIDIYDGASAYREHMEMLRRALLTRDTVTELQVIRWFEEHYPLTTHRYAEAAHAATG